MAIRGSLKEASLSDVCQLLALGQKTGCLAISDRSRFGRIYFDRGRISFATIVNRRDRLGDLLAREGVVTSAQLSQAVARQRQEPEKRLGEVLVELGAISPERLQEYIRRQIEDAVYSLFTWSRGNFFFEAEEQPEAGETLVSLNAEGLLLEAARRVDEWDLIQKKIPSLDLVYQLDKERVDDTGVELTPEQQRIAPLLDGQRTIHELIDETGLTELDVGKALYGFIQAGLANRVGTGETREAPRARDTEVEQRRNLGIAFYKAGLLEESAREFRRVLELSASDESARFHIALLDLRTGRNRQAVRGLKTLVETAGPRYSTFMNLAVALRRLGRIADALLVLQEAERLRPGSSDVALARAVTHLEADDLAAAEEQLAEVLRRGANGQLPGRLYWHTAALLAARKGDLHRAATLAREGLEQEPGSAPLLVLAGAIAERQGNFEYAERLYRQAADEDPSIPQVHKNLGDIAYRHGLHDEAADHFQRALERRPELGDDTYARLGNLMYHRGDRDEAVRAWQRALELNPENDVVRANLQVVESAGS